MENTIEIKEEEDSSCDEDDDCITIESESTSEDDSDIGANEKEDDKLVTSDGEFKCTLCSKSYSRNHNLRRHIREKHAASKGGSKKSVSCKFCPKLYSNTSARNRHVKKEHAKILSAAKAGKKQAQEKNMPIPWYSDRSITHCPLCYCNIKLHNIYLHISREHGDAPQSKKPAKFYEGGSFECPICKKVTNGATGLLNHLEESHDGKHPPTFECEICFKSCKHWVNFQKHKKTHL